MLYSIKELQTHKVSGTDGDIGKIVDFYFDDKEWTIRYAVVDTNSWLPGGRVLISTTDFCEPNMAEKKFNVILTKEQIKNSPDIDVNKPISRQMQENLHLYYGWPIYWGSGLTPNSQTNSLAPLPMIYPFRNIPSADREGIGDSHLRSAKEVIDYTIQTSTGEMGKVRDFIIGNDLWAIRYMLMDTGNWIPGKKVLIAPEWIKWISWDQKKVAIWPTKENIEKCPSLDVEYPINRNYEDKLYEYYDYSRYWTK